MNKFLRHSSPSTRLRAGETLTDQNYQLDIDAETAPRLIHDLVEYFGRGEMIFDVMGEMLIKFTDFNKFLRSSKSAFQWGVDDARIVETFHPTLKLKENVFRKEYMVST